MPIDGLNGFFDHAETISQRNVDRIAELGGGIAVQYRMAYQGEYFAERYGTAAASNTPPVKQMLDSGVNVSAGTNATRVASYNPWVSLAWLITCKTVGGMKLYDQDNLVDRETSLRMWTEKVAWFSNQVGERGRIEVGHLADFIVLSKDFFSVAENEIPYLTSNMTVVGGKVVYADGEFSDHDTPLPPAIPDWSPVNQYGGYGAWGEPEGAGKNFLEPLMNQAAMACGCASACTLHGHNHAKAWTSKAPVSNFKDFFGAFGCSCWAV